MANQHTKKKEANEASAPVTRAEFNELSSGVDKLIGLIENGALAHAAAPAVDVLPEVSQKQAEKAKPNRVETNPEWEEIAREVLGEALDHTEVEHSRAGGINFTVVIKLEYSNADQQYKEMVKTDRRTKEVSQEGIQGVEDWCKQIKANLARYRVGAGIAGRK